MVVRLGLKTGDPGVEKCQLLPFRSRFRLGTGDSRVPFRVTSKIKPHCLFMFAYSLARCRIGVCGGLTATGARCKTCVSPRHHFRWRHQTTAAGRSAKESKARIQRSPTRHRSPPLPPAPRKSAFRARAGRDGSFDNRQGFTDPSKLPTGCMNLAHLKKYRERPGPPFLGNLCRGVIALGNDGLAYESRSSGRAGVFRWYKL